MPSILSLAQRACIDVLDKIAVATSELFAIPGHQKNVYFSNRWLVAKKGQSLTWDAVIGPEIEKAIRRCLPWLSFPWIFARMVPYNRKKPIVTLPRTDSQCFMM